MITMGGNAGIRGYLIQTIIGVLDALEKDATWNALSFEPKNDSEKVDICWYYGTSIKKKVSQIKSSQNAIFPRDARLWANQVEKSTLADEYELIIVGFPSSGVKKLVKIGKVAIILKQLDITSLIEQAAQKLGKYHQERSQKPLRALNYEILVKAIIEQFAEFSTKGEVIKRETFDSLIIKWIQSILKEENSNNIYEISKKINPSTFWIEIIKKVQIKEPKYFIDPPIEVVGKGFLDYLTKKNRKKDSGLNVFGNFLNNVDQKILAVLAGAGMGKSTLCKKVFHLILQEFQSKKDFYVPIFLQFKDINPEKLIQNFWEEICRYLNCFIEFQDLDIQFIKESCNSLRFLFILDGFDELSPAINFSSWLEKCSNKLEIKDKLLVTCRKELFTSIDTLSLKGEHILFTELLPWNEQFIENYLELYYKNPKLVKNRYSLLQQYPSLMELISCPFLLAEIVDNIKNIISKLHSQSEINRPIVYNFLIQIWMDKIRNRFDVEKSYPHLTPRILKKFCHIIAAISLLTNGYFNLHDAKTWNVIPLTLWINRIEQGALLQDQLDISHPNTLENVMKMHTFLEEREEYVYEFRHRSIAEFLLAEWVAILLCTELNKENLTDRYERNEYSAIRRFIITEREQRNLQPTEEFLQEVQQLKVILFNAKFFTVNSWQLLIEICNREEISELVLNNLTIFFKSDCPTQLSRVIFQWIIDNKGKNVFESWASTNLITQEKLDLSNFGLNSITFLMNLETLTFLNLDSNNLKEIPESIYQLKNLKTLKMNRNLISTIPDSFGRIISLEFVELERNKLTKIPPSLSNLINIKSLLLNFNNIEVIPEDIGNLTRMINFEIKQNKLEELPQSLFKLERLEKMAISLNELKYLPPGPWCLDKLCELIINSNELAALPESIGDLNNLHDLEIDNNLLLALPESLGNLVNLKTLSLNFNKLTTLPNSLSNLVHLKKLYLGYNELTGFALDFNRLQNLEELYAGFNKILMIPDSIGELKKLKILKIPNNSIDHIPDTICNLNQLEKLSLSNNQIANLPSNLIKLNLLKYIWIVGNNSLMISKPFTTHLQKIGSKIFV